MFIYGEYDPWIAGAFDLIAFVAAHDLYIAVVFARPIGPFAGFAIALVGGFVEQSELPRDVSSEIDRCV